MGNGQDVLVCGVRATAAAVDVRVEANQWLVRQGRLFINTKVNTVSFDQPETSCSGSRMGQILVVLFNQQQSVRTSCELT